MTLASIGEEAFASTIERATVALAAEMLGTARWLCDTTIEYAKVRLQFGSRSAAFRPSSTSSPTCEAAKLCATDGIQIHGGIGYTLEHDLHLYIRRAYASEFLLGHGDCHRDRLGALIL